MTRYTINIGDEFPLHDERPGAANRRWGFGLRALFVLAVAVIVLTHPFKAVVLLGLALFLRQSRWFAEARARWNAGREARREAWRNHGPRAQAARASCGARWNDRRESRDERPDRYKAFV